MDKSYTRAEIRDGFVKWIERAKTEGWENLEDAQDPDVSAEYLVELMDEARAAA